MEQLCGVEWITERDIDIFLTEELRLNASFAGWLTSRCIAGPGLALPARETRVSVIFDRETDVLALFTREGGGTFALLIEDKIAAEFQPDQMTDYVKRGEQGIRDRLWDGFAVAVFAPRNRFPIGDLPVGIACISFEDAADILDGTGAGDARARYRAEFLRRAASPRIATVRPVDQETQQWWGEVNALVRETYGDFLLPSNPSNDSWVAPRWRGQPAWLRLDIKGRTGQVALALKGVSEKAARALLASCPHEGFDVMKRAGWVDPAIVAVDEFPKYVVKDDLAVARDAILAAYGQAFAIYQFWRANRDKFDLLAPR
jgi:hypothetical protein